MGGRRDVHAELEQWVEKLREMEPASKRVGDLRALDKLLDRLPGPEAGQWLDDHRADINRVLIPMSRPTNDQH